MTTVNIHEAKTHLSRLLDQAVAGQPFIIAKAGRPLVVVQAVDSATPPRVGFLKGLGIPEDFDTWQSDAVADLFGGSR